MRVAVLASGFMGQALDHLEQWRCAVGDADVFLATSRRNPKGRELTEDDLRRVFKTWRLKGVGDADRDPEYLDALTDQLRFYEEIVSGFLPRLPAEYVTAPYRLSCIDQYLRLRWAWELMNRSVVWKIRAPYDVIARVRPDFLFDEPLSFEAPEENVIYTCGKEQFYDQDRRYLKEYLFWARRDTFAKLARFVDHYGEILDPPFEPGDTSDYTLCPEYQFFLFVRRLGIEVQFLPLTCTWDGPYRVVRAQPVDGEDRVRL